jgi:hypothetical protein
LLEEATKRIEKRMGLDQYKAAIQALKAKDYKLGTQIALIYYDKTYLHSLAKRPENNIHRLDISTENSNEIAKMLVEM